MYSIKIDPKYNKYQNPKIGLIALASDYMIEKDFINVIKPTLELELTLYLGSIFVEYIFKKKIYHKVFNIHYN